MSLPGMGRSAELNGVTEEQNMTMRQAFSQRVLQVEFEEEPGVFHAVTNLWPDPHSMDRLTVFIK